jgi:hypothetical protein
VTDLKVRDIDFRLDEDIPLHWNPGNKHFGNFVNVMALFGPVSLLKTPSTAQSLMFSRLGSS